MNQTPLYDGYEPEYRRPAPKRRSNAGLIILVIILGLLAGAAGTWLMNRYLADNTTPLAQHAPVTLETVQTASQPDQDGKTGSIIEQVAATGKASIVEITTESKVTHPFFGSYVTGGAGSGVILSEDGYIATNDHVINGSDTIVVRLPDDSVYEAVLIGTDAQTDLAVIKINATGLAPVTFADSDQVVVGELAVAIGNPLGTLGGTVTEGIISAKDREIIIQGEAMVLLQTSAAISPGNSGGGLFDQHGYLVGIVNAKSGEENVEGIGFAIPSNTAKSVLGALIENGYVPGRPILGIEASTVSGYDAMYRYNTTRSGIYVTDVISGTNLQRGDRVIAVDGMEVSSVSELKAMVSRYEVGDTLNVTVARNGRQGEVEVELREKGASTSETLI